jgi:hypothetical protein
MILEKTKVNWPQTLALFYPPKNNAFQMRFDEEATLQATVELDPDRPKSSDVPIDTVLHCAIVESYYCPRVYALPLEGKEAPRGKIGLYVNAELQMEGEISSFVLGAEPLDCLEKRSSWKTTSNQYPALPMLDGSSADPSRQIGIMMTNGDRVEVRLSDLAANEKMTLEVGVLAAMYSTRNVTPRTAIEKLIASSMVLRECRGGEHENGAWRDFLGALSAIEEQKA